MDPAPPLPYLFQRRRCAGTSVVISDTGLRDLLARAARRAGLRDPDGVVAHLQAFMARRRAARPAEEYREPTAVEWAEFEQHFGKRTMELGYCRRPYGTPCIHEHACIRCPMLEVAPAMQPRLLEIQSSTRARLDLASTRGWLGEVEALELNLVHIGEKLAQVERANAWRPQIIQQLLDMPS